MAKVLCGISGIEFTCQYVPMRLETRKYVHPIFCLKQSELIKLYQRYKYNELDEISSYLLFLAYLNSTELVEWRVPAQITAKTEKIIANNFQFLVTVVQHMNSIQSPSVKYARISVSPDTKNLENVAYWIESWKCSIEDFHEGTRKYAQKRTVAELESRLDYIIKDPNRKEEILAARLADWAEKAASFPKNIILVDGAKVSVAERWKHIIRKCINEESVFSVEKEDLQTIISHCEQNLELGSIYSYNLIHILNKGLKAQDDFCGLQDFSFTILDGNESVEQQNILSIAASATSTSEAPRREQFNSNFQYLKAKIAWEFKQELAQQFNL